MVKQYIVFDKGKRKVRTYSFGDKPIDICKPKLWNPKMIG